MKARILVGDPVELTFGFGRVERAHITAIEWTRWGLVYICTTDDDGDIEYVSSFDDGPGIGARLL